MSGSVDDVDPVPFPLHRAVLGAMVIPFSRSSSLLSMNRSSTRALSRNNLCGFENGVDEGGLAVSMWAIIARLRMCSALLIKLRSSECGHG